MKTQPLQPIVRVAHAAIIALTLILASGLSPRGSAAQTNPELEAGLTSETTYTSPRFGYDVEWDAAFEHYFVLSEERDERYLIDDGEINLFIIGQATSATPAEILSQSIEISLENFDDAEVISEELDGERPSAYLSFELAGERHLQRKESRALASGDGVLSVTVQVSTAAMADLTAAVALVAGSALLDGQPILDEAASTAPAPSPDTGPVDIGRSEYDEMRGGGAPTGDDLSETYESPNYGFSLSYDPAEWQVGLEDEDTDDPYDFVQLQHDLGFVSVYGDPDYTPNQLDNCVADYRNGLEQNPAVANVEEAPELAGEAEGRLWGVFTYELSVESGDSLDLIRYIECQVMGELTIVVIQSSLETDFDEFVAAREELMDGFSPPG